MKTTQLLIYIGLASTVHAGLARRDCGQTKSFTATNNCGVTYGGTWIECATGISGIPTFTVPECTESASAPAITDIYPTFTSVDSPITSAPEPIFPTGPPYANGSCSALWICVDAIAVCGSETIGYGACYDTCTKTEITAPPCTLPSITPTPTQTSGMNSTTVAVSTPPPREHKGFCDEKPFLCAPKGW